MPLSIIDGLVPFLQPECGERVMRRVAATPDLDEAAQWETIFEEAIQGNDIFLSRRMRFPGRSQLKTLLTEILIDQEYYFHNDTAKPLIIDAGANFGLATFFFKRIYRDCRIVALEPNPMLAEIYRVNVSRNTYADVTFIEAALGTASHAPVFWQSRREDPASSLLPDRAPGDAVPLPVRIQALSELITEPVFLLKLDVEGVEHEVLREARDTLSLVANVVCECHAVGDGNTLTGVLKVLDDAGFRTAVTRASWDERKSRARFSRTIASDRSYLVYAAREPYRA